jgi:hypothetical protein
MAANANLRRLAKTVSRQPEWILALTISLAVVWLHFFFLWHAGGFWRDEVNLINLSGRHSLTEMSKDSFPVLMPLLVSGWTAIGLGQNDLSLRLLGTLIGLALPAALWLAAWKIRRAPPLLGLVLLTLNSTVIMFGDSLRAFGLGSVLILLTTAATGWFLKNPTWRRAGCLATLAILSVQSLYQNAVFIAAICFGAWAVCARQKKRRGAVKILVVGAVAAASLLPYWARIVSMPASAAALRTGFDPMYVFINFDNAAGFPMLQYTWVWEFLALAVVVCGFVSLFARKRHGGFAGNGSPEDAPMFGKTTSLMALFAVTGFFWFAASPATRWCFFPLMAVAIMWCDFRAERRSPTRREDCGEFQRAGSKTGAPADNDMALFAGATLLAAFVGFAGFLWYAALVSEPWYFLPLLALTAAAFELGLPLASRHFRAAIFGFAAMTIVLAIPAAQGDLNQRFTNVDLVAQRLTKEAGPDDFIIVTPWYCGITFDRYYKGPASWNTLPPLTDHSTHRYDLVRGKMETRGAIQPVLDQMAATLQAGHSVWVVGRITIPAPGKPLPPDLPPPPLKYSNWSDQPYNRNWVAQAAGFLSNHSRQFQQVYYSTNLNVSFTENLPLQMAEGWQNSPASSTTVPRGAASENFPAAADNAPEKTTRQ